MPVYVDNFYVTGITFRGMKMCHMIADTHEELIAMVRSIGVQEKWIQCKDTCNEHFDICFSKRAKALKAGAVEIGYREYAERVQNKAKKARIPWTHTSITKLKKSNGYYR